MLVILVLARQIEGDNLQEANLAQPVSLQARERPGLKTEGGAGEMAQ